MATPAKSSAAPRERCLLRTGFPSDLFEQNKGQFSHPGSSSPRGRCHSGGLSSSTPFIENIIKFQAVCEPRGVLPTWSCLGLLWVPAKSSTLGSGTVEEPPHISLLGILGSSVPCGSQVWGQEGDFPFTLNFTLLLPELCTAHSKPQPGFQHLGILSPGVPEPTEQLVVLSWTHSRAPCSARELAQGS